jgi:hypothetical protein
VKDLVNSKEYKDHIQGIKKQSNEEKQKNEEKHEKVAEEIRSKTDEIIG